MCKGAIWQHMLHILRTKILISLTAPKKKKKRATKKEPTFLKMEVMGKSSQENGPKAEKEKKSTPTASTLVKQTIRPLFSLNIKLMQQNILFTPSPPTTSVWATN